MMSTKRLVVVVGPTGSGKTSLAIAIARHYSAPIISTDSRQFYRGIPVGTAQPTAEELAAAPHHMIACRELEDEFNAGAYEIEALNVLDQLFKEGDLVVAVGGSGLYIDALCEGLDDLPDVDPELRASLRERVVNEGVESLCEQLRELDPAFYEVVDRANPSRVVRALEVCLQSGRPYSELRQAKTKTRPFEIVKVGIDMPREELYNRINQRVDMMLEQGLESEARSVYSKRHLNALQTVGYREMFNFFDGEISREEAVELIKRNSRRYAKRQMTWFRRAKSTYWLNRADGEAAVEWLDQK